jgi:hypothetical protein
MLKNTAGQNWVVHAIDTTTGNNKTGDAANITAKISKDGGAFVALTDTNPVEIEAGRYAFDISQAEINCTRFFIVPRSSTANVRVENEEKVFTTVPPIPEVNVVEVNGKDAASGIVRINIIDASYVRKGVLTLTRGDTYSIANGNPIEFISTEFPDLTVPTGATLKLFNKTTRTTLLTKTTTLLDDVEKSIKFEATAADMNIAINDKDYVYSVELTCAIGKRTVISDKLIINDDLVP